MQILKQAADVAGKSQSSMRAWAEEHGLGHRVGGRVWMMSKVALGMFLYNNRLALPLTFPGIAQVQW
jgi:hypothetical protein